MKKFIKEIEPYDNLDEIKEEEINGYDRKDVLEFHPNVAIICKSKLHTNTCQKCPIESACIAPTGPSKDTLNKWIKNINNISENLIIQKFSNGNNHSEI